MRLWRDALLRRGLLEVAAALAAGYAVVQLIEALVGIPLGVLAQYLDPPPKTVLGALQIFSGSYLSFHVRGTEVFYGPVLATFLTLVLVALVLNVVRRLGDRLLGTCPYCLSAVPLAATACADCTNVFETD